MFHKIDTYIEKLDDNTAKQLLKELIKPHFMPVFGAARLVEHEVAVIRVLKEIKYLTENADEYEYIEKLAVTKTKARNLIYQESLRQDLNIEEKLREILKNPRIQKDKNGFFLIEISNPLIMDKFRERIRKLGFISDGTFSNSLARISEEALICVIESLLSKQEKTEAKKILIEQGVTDKSLKGFIKEALKNIGKKAANEVGEHVAENFGVAIENIFDVSSDFFKKIINRMKENDD